MWTPKRFPYFWYDLVVAFWALMAALLVYSVI